MGGPHKYVCICVYLCVYVCMYTNMHIVYAGAQGPGQMFTWHVNYPKKDSAHLRPQALFQTQARYV